MKLVFLCKRRPMGRDLIERPYGRFFYIPKLLAAYGHEVHIALLSYESDPPLNLQRDGIHWVSESIRTLGGIGYLRTASKLVDQTNPDWIVGFSDTYYGILAEHLARTRKVRSLIDAYDNYEGYIPWCKPLHMLWRKSLRRATAISVAGPALGALNGQGRSGNTFIVPMAPDPLGFAPKAREQCRRKLDLPLNGTLIGYCGALYPNRGVETLFAAFQTLRAFVPDAHLVLSGRLHKGVSVPPEAIWLGYRPDDDMPALINSMNVLAVVNRPSAFGNYSHPIKLYEAMACGVPVVATRTPATEWILAAYPELLVNPERQGALATALRAALSMDRIDYGLQPTWESVARNLSGALSEASGGRMLPPGQTDY